MATKSPTVDKARSVIYVRVSTKGQDEKYSPKVQENTCRRYAKDQNLKVIKEFREAGSAWKLNARDEFYEMLEFIKAEKIPNVIFAFGDRLSRNTEDYVQLKGTDVRFHNSITGRSFNPNDPEDFDETASFEHDQAEAKRYSAKLRKRVITAQLEKVEKGEYPAAAPLGYTYKPEMVGGKWKNIISVDPDRGPLIKKLYELYSTGEYTLREITEKIKNLGLRSKHDRVLTHEEIRRYLKTPFYYGRFRWGGIEYDNQGTYEPIISKALFDTVQEVLAGKSVVVKWGRDFKYKGLLQCHLCGCAMVGDEQNKTLKSTGEQKTYLYYHCTSGKKTEFYQAKFGQDRCPLYHRPYYTEKEVDEFLEREIEGLYVDPETFEWIRQQLESGYQNLKELNEAEIESLKKEYSRIESQESSLIGLIAEASQNSAKDKIKAAYEKRLEQMEVREAEIEAQLDQLQHGEEAISLEEIEDTLELSKALKDKYLAASPEKRRKLNNLMFRNVLVTYKNSLIIPDGEEKYISAVPLYIVWNEPFQSLWQIGFIQGMADAEAEARERAKVEKSAKIKIWRGRRDLNSRPLA